MPPIIIYFRPSGLGRVVFYADVSTGDRKSFDSVWFKLDTGSDFTTISYETLLSLGYTREFLRICPRYGVRASTASEESGLVLQYIDNISIKFGSREIQGCRIYFSRKTELRSLFGCDILRYFNTEINYDTGELRLTKTSEDPPVPENGRRIHIYTAEGGGV